MRIAVAGATGNVGARTVAVLERDGHDVVRISRSLGVDLNTGKGLDDALAGVEVVIDAVSMPHADVKETVEYFGTMTRNLLAAGERAKVRHHVLISIAGVHKVDADPHYFGKREQERLVEAGPVPWTIMPFTQFHDFAAMTAEWTEKDGVATVAPLLLQPIDPDDVAEILAEIAVGEPQGRYVDVAGPETQDLVDMARRTYQARGRDIKLVPTWSGIFGPNTAGEVLLPGKDARIAPTTFEEWLKTQKPTAKA
ncbi:SDR family oxidoreductase [Saccharomonospora glauca]|uniref:Putative nucleoside-diphosphate sugar epimerase n=1 Tax=Saccharomonospora glauca K62 TaxID=928724 RepID=I1D2P0_9PSEU|nr:NAD(P)H-binding protein [Saccharomonospora glauca]EIE99214.1 putative nucleoside-diphosphate sugar epimerase [Saccharomonospora glauca K62]